jgi:hypothetical protein
LFELYKHIRCLDTKNTFYSHVQLKSQLALVQSVVIFSTVHLQRIPLLFVGRIRGAWFCLLVLAYFPYFEKNNSRLMISPCCLCVCRCIPPTTFECRLETSSPKERVVGEEAARDLTPLGCSGRAALRSEWLEKRQRET